MSMPKRLLSVLCTLALLFTMMPVSAFAEESATATVTLDVTSSSGSTYAIPGDMITATVSISDAANLEGLLGILTFLYYDPEILQVLDTESEEGFTTNYLTTGPIVSANTVGTQKPAYDFTMESIANGLSFFLQAGANLTTGGTAPKLTNEPQLFVSYTFKVRDDLKDKEKSLDNVITRFEVDPDNFLSGKNGKNDIDIKNVACSITYGKKVSVDTVPPTIDLGGKTEFKYQPVEFTVSDASGIKSVVISGKTLEPMDGKYQVTAGGALAVTDNCDNTTSIDLIIDAADFNAAKEAVGKIPDPVKYSDKTLVKDAQTALARVTDGDAVARLAAEKTKADHAAAVIALIEDRISALNTKMIGLAENMSSATALAEAKTELETLQELGVTTGDLNQAAYQNYQRVQQALADILKTLEGFQKRLDALKEKTQQLFTYKDAEELAALEEILSGLNKKGYNLETQDPDRYTVLNQLKAARTGLVNARSALADKVATASLTPDFVDTNRAKITALRTEVNTFEETYFTTFTAEELAKLSSAEAGIAALDTRYQAVSDNLAGLPVRSDIKLTQKAELNELKTELDALKALSAVFENESKLTEALSEIAVIEAEITTVDRAISANDGLAPESPDKINEFMALRNRVEALLTRGVVSTDLTNYGTYQTMVSRFESAIQKVEAVKNAINGLPDAADVVFSSSSQIEQVKAVIDKLENDYGSGILTAEQKKPFTEAKAALDALTAKRAAIVTEISSTNFVIKLDTASQNVITELRAKVDALNAKGASFTEAELKKLTDAEKALAELKAESAKLHQEINALPTGEAVRYSDKDKVDELKAKMTALAAKGDSFTEAENQKIANVEREIQSLEAAKDALIVEMGNVKDSSDVKYGDQTTNAQLKEKEKALAARGVTLSESNASVVRYRAFAGAVAAMESEIAAAKTAMDNALANWHYGADQKAYEDIRRAMDALKGKYAMTGEEFVNEFPNYNTNVEYNNKADDKANEIRVMLSNLPAADKAEIGHEEAFRKANEAVKDFARVYQQDEAALATLFGQNYANMKKGLERVEALKRAVSADTHPEIAEAIANGTWGVDDSKPVAPVRQTAPVRIPQTSDDFPYGLMFVMLGIGVLGMLFFVRKKKNL